MAEIGGFFAVCRESGVWPGGVHLEFTGEDVTECLGGAEEVLEDQLSVRYHTLCDPRLNARQSLDLAFRLAELMRTVAAAGGRSDLMRVAVVGLGLIGGSVGLAAAARGDEVVAFDPDPDAAAAGLERGAAARVEGSLEAAVAGRRDRRRLRPGRPAARAGGAHARGDRATAARCPTSARRRRG